VRANGRRGEIAGRAGRRQAVACEKIGEKIVWRYKWETKRGKNGGATVVGCRAQGGWVGSPAICRGTKTRKVRKGSRPATGA